MDFIGSNYRSRTLFDSFSICNHLQLSVVGLAGFYYNIDVLINSQKVASLIENGGASLSPPGSGNDPYPAHIRHVIEARMDIGDGLVLFTRDNLFEYKNAGQSDENKCYNHLTIRHVHDRRQVASVHVFDWTIVETI